MENTSTLEADLQLLKEATNWSSENEYAILYRSERKKIMRGQLDLIQFIRKVLRESCGIQHMMESGVAEAQILEFYKQIYGQKTRQELA